jgi:hypothetical protein
MVDFMRKMPSSLTILIKRDIDGNLTEDALLYQDILKYSRIVTEFDLHNLTAWLLDNNNDFINDFKSLDKRNYTRANRINNKRRYVQYRVDELEYFQIVKKYRTKISQKKVNMQFYKVTIFGKLLFFLIEYNDLRDNDNQRKKLAETIYELLYNLKNYKDSMSLFHFYFFKTLREWNFFEFYVDRLTKILFTSEIIYNDRDLFEKSNNPAIMDDLWEVQKEAHAESFRKLEPEKKKYYMFNLKSKIEAQERNTVRNFEHYERLAFSTRNDYETFVKEVDCSYCNTYFSMTFNLKGILERSNDKESIVCPNCNKCL